MSRFILAAIASGLIATGASAAPMQMGLPQTLAQWAQGAQHFDGLGDFHRKVSTKSEAAQAYFDQGMRFLWAFNHDEATRSFAKAAELDPECASCLWGVALTLGPNYNMPMMAQARAKVGWDALQRAKQLSPKATPVEQALIQALEPRFNGSQPLDPVSGPPRLAAYADAMKLVAQRFPNDLDVQTLYAEALMNKNPWKLWNADGAPAPGTAEIVATLEGVLAKDPHHPGANHYYVHAIEASPHPEKALASAERLEGMMPAAGHLEHMPAHILQRVGQYDASVEANRKGADADIAYLAKTNAPDYYPMYTAHNYQFLAYSAAMEGRRSDTIEAMRKARVVFPDEMLADMPGADWVTGGLYAAMIRFGMWDDALAEPAPPAKLAGMHVLYLEAKSDALASKGRLDEAEAAARELDQVAAGASADALCGMNLAKTCYGMASLRAQARIALARNQPDRAIALLRQAVAKEDSLDYNEPSDAFFPTRHMLGAALMKAGRPGEAEAVYREDLKRNPENGWALYGLKAALEAQGRQADAQDAGRRFATAWSRADVKLTASAY